MESAQLNIYNNVVAKPRVGFVPYDLASFEGDSLELECPIRVAGQPVGQPTWFFNGIRVIPDGVNVVLNSSGNSKCIKSPSTHVCT